jgi:hypothetical protein
VPRTTVLAVVGVLTIALAGACTDATGGQAVPGDSNGGSTGTPSGEPPSTGDSEPTVEIPPRPRELSLDGIEPCSLLTQAQLAQLATEFRFDEPPTSETGDAGAYCAVGQTAEPFNVVDIELVTDEGIEPWLSGDRNVDAWLVSIAGFPAASYKLAGTDDEECATSVGVADGQQLTVDLQALVDTDYRELCRVTEQVATMATQTLQTLR